MPGTKQSEDLTAEITGEEAINLIQSPHQRRLDLAERFTPQIPLKIDARPAPGMPGVIGRHIRIELIRDDFSQRKIKRIRRCHLFRAEFF